MKLLKKILQQLHDQDANNTVVWVLRVQMFQPLPGY